MNLVSSTDVAGQPVTIIEETPAPPGYTIRQLEAVLPGDSLAAVRYVSVVGSS